MTRPSKTSSELTITHYSRPEVKEIIIKFCDENGQSWRALNGDEGWYITTENNQVRLRNPEDYDSTINKFRTLYSTLDIFENKVKEIKKTWGENKPSEVIGTFKDCYGYTLGADIDSIEHDLTDPQNRLAVEQMAQYLVQRLFDAEIKKSVYCLQSGGGIYVLLHHSLCSFYYPSPGDENQREKFFRTTTASFKMWLADVEKEFFKLHPELKNKVKIDKLTNQKRKFKVIFSIHKTHELAVIPLDPANISINLEKAKLPISDEVIAEGKKWYIENDPEERTRLIEILEPSREGS